MEWVYIISMLASILGEAGRSIAEDVKNNQDITANDINNAMLKLLNVARAKGENKLSQLQDKLYQVQSTTRISPTVKDALRGYDKQIARDISKLRSDIADIDFTAIQADNRLATAQSAQATGSRRFKIDQALNKNKEEITNATKEIEKIIEKKI